MAAGGLTITLAIARSDARLAVPSVRGVGSGPGLVCLCHRRCRAGSADRREHTRRLLRPLRRRLQRMSQLEREQDARKGFHRLSETAGRLQSQMRSGKVLNESWMSGAEGWVE